MSNFPEGLLHLSVIHFKAGHAECLKGAGRRLILLVLVHMKVTSLAWQLIAFLPAASSSCGRCVLHPRPGEPLGGVTPQPGFGSGGIHQSQRL